MEQFIIFRKHSWSSRTVMPFMLTVSAFFPLAQAALLLFQSLQLAVGTARCSQMGGVVNAAAEHPLQGLGVGRARAAICVRPLGVPCWDRLFGFFVLALKRMANGFGRYLYSILILPGSYLNPRRVMSIKQRIVPWKTEAVKWIPAPHKKTFAQRLQLERFRNLMPRSGATHIKLYHFLGSVLVDLRWKTFSDFAAKERILRSVFLFIRHSCSTLRRWATQPNADLCVFNGLFPICYLGLKEGWVWQGCLEPRQMGRTWWKVASRRVVTRWRYWFF